MPDPWLALKTGPKAARLAALAALERDVSRTRYAIDRLVPWLHADDVEVRRAAVRAVAACRPEMGLGLKELAGRAVLDVDAEIREVAFKGLTRWPSEVRLSLNALASKLPLAPKEAEPRALAALVVVVRSLREGAAPRHGRDAKRASSPYRRAPAVEAEQAGASPEAAYALLRSALPGRNGKTRRSIARAIVTLATAFPEVRALALRQSRGPSMTERVAAAELLAERRWDVEARRELVRLAVEDRSREVRQQAARMLVERPEQGEVALLWEAVRSPGAGQRRALSVLAALGSRAAPIEEAVLGAALSSDARVRRLACEVLAFGAPEGESGAARAEAALARCALERDPVVRKAAEVARRIKP